MRAELVHWIKCHLLHPKEADHYISNEIVDAIVLDLGIVSNKISSLIPPFFLTGVIFNKESF